MQLVELDQYIADLIIDMRYATDRNVVGRAISDEANPRLIVKAAEAIRHVSRTLSQQGYQLVIWDAYRTPAVQKILQSFEPDQRYVLEESKHCQGLAIDLTLADKSGNLLDMGTDHDDFSARAHADTPDLSAEQSRNRQLLTTVMEREGFTQWPYEWWHFDFEQ